MYKLNVEGGRGRETRRKGDGRCTEGRRDKAGSRIPKVVGSGRKKEKYAILCNFSQLENCKEAGANKYRVGTGIKGCGKWEV